MPADATQVTGTLKVPLLGRAALLTVAMAALIVLWPASAEARSTLRLSVSPSRATVGERTCFSFRITGSNGRPVSQADVSFQGKTLMGDRSGRARLCTRLKWAGRHFATAFKFGYNPRAAFVRAVRSGPPKATGGDWHVAKVYIAAYGSDGECGQYTFNLNGGVCHGSINDGADPLDPPAGPASFDWKGNPDGQLSLELDTRGYGSRLSGRTPGPASDQFYMERGHLGRNSASSGSDPAKTGQRGGPLHLNVTYHNPFLGRRGYTIDISGYVWF